MPVSLIPLPIVTIPLPLFFPTFLHNLPTLIAAPDIIPIKLKPTRHQSLKDTGWIILMRYRPQEILIPPPIASDRVLRLQGIVQVHIPIILLSGFRERDSLAEEGFGGFVDGAVVFGEGPLDGKVEDCRGGMKC